MSKFSVANQLIESEYFNWKCIICNILAKSPLLLEDQFMAEHGYCCDINGTEWVKCYTCFSPYHLACTKDTSPVGEYSCSFMECKNTNFSLKFYFIFFHLKMPGGGKKKKPKCKKEGKGDVGCKRGASQGRTLTCEMPRMNTKSKKCFAFKIHSFLSVYM